MNRAEKDILKDEIIKDIQIKKKQKREDLFEKIGLIFLLIIFFGFIAAIPISILLESNYDFLAGTIAGIVSMTTIAIYKKIED